MCQVRNDSAPSLLGDRLVLKRWRLAPACYDRPACDVRQQLLWVTPVSGAPAPALRVATAGCCASLHRDNYGNDWRNSTRGAQENCASLYTSRQPLPPSPPLLACVIDRFLQNKRVNRYASILALRSLSQKPSSTRYRRTGHGSLLSAEGSGAS